MLAARLLVAAVSAAVVAGPTCALAAGPHTDRVQGGWQTAQLSDLERRRERDRRLKEHRDRLRKLQDNRARERERLEYRERLRRKRVERDRQLDFNLYRERQHIESEERFRRQDPRYRRNRYRYRPQSYSDTLEDDAFQDLVESYVELFLSPPLQPLTRRYTLEEIIDDPDVRALVGGVTINAIRFAPGSARIEATGLAPLKALADAIVQTLEREPKQVFLLAGHTDAKGPDEENLELSQKRAMAIRDELVERFGIPEANLKAVGYGERYLRVQSAGYEARNRRVEVRAIGGLLAEEQG